MLETDLLILGGGLAGLSTALHARRPYLLIERADRPGGLCATEARDGFLFDRAGHWLHLRDPAMRALAEEVLPGGWLTVQRRAGVWSRGVLTRYPYQVNTCGLPPEVVAENVLGFVEAQLGEGGRALREREPRDFAEFILRHLGEGFARNFMFPYNTKLWTVHPRELSAAWTARFVPRPTLAQVVRGALGLEGDDAGYNATFLYPRQGGIEAFARALAARLPTPPRCGVRPVALDAARRVATLSTGDEVRWRDAVSTIPLPELVGLCVDAPAPVREAAARLRATTVTYVNVGARDAGAPPFHWIYLPEERHLPYRVGSPSSAVPALAPAGTRSFCVELSAAAPVDPAVATREALAVLLEVGLVRRREEILFADVRSIPHAYVLHDHACAPARDAIARWLEGHRVLLAGRAGRWEYSSMEDALLAGRECAKRIG